MNQQQQKISQADTIKPLSSVPLQTLLYFHYMYALYYFFMEIILFFYKGYGLFYPASTMANEIVRLFFFAVISFVRIYFGGMGNKTESPKIMIGFLIISLFTLLGYFYFLSLQTYVLMLEFIIGIIGGVMVILEILFSIFALLAFKNFEKMH
ncbi:hypothetical protein PPERSA_08286 [Pseudocohnilembus persalinus]|uniref:Transmembrane protein n=1 Tax=Pseudocohnilembus persalinus TaxID=266149 RepID=A0A0V0QPN2_PSEPJ|nr:hypothetical protein PPERSA_08286 [Pseudocohnilembus persalinus]|eukprot:KRX04071.1 hypothetical protein PPERSA_08286 [Pseudocohnilembus persalinus]